MSHEVSVQSMTGHAVLEKRIGVINYRFQIKSINHRFLELKFKVPRAWSGLEVTVRQKVQAALRRGSVEIWIEKVNAASTEAQSTNQVQGFFKELEKSLQSVSGISQLLIPTPLRAGILARYPDVWLKNAGEEVWTEVLETHVLQAFDELILQLVKKREQEGLGLLNVLKKILAQLEGHLGVLEQKLPESRKLWEDKIRARFKELAAELELTTLPEERIYSEFLILAEKRDVAEEIDRIKLHLNHLKELLNKSDTHMGKRLDFLMQELHREWTTLGNKIQNAGLAPLVMDAKLGLEQIREQIQNLI